MRGVRYLLASRRRTGRFGAGDLFVFDDFDGLFLAPRAFKGALIVVWRIGGLDTDEPHLSATRFATREAHRPRLPNYLKGRTPPAHVCFCLFLVRLKPLRI